MSGLERTKISHGALETLLRRDEHDTAWMVLEAELADVEAELAGIASEFALVPVDDHEWRHHDARTDLIVQVTSKSDGIRTMVGVRIAPMRWTKPGRALRRKPVHFGLWILLGYLYFVYLFVRLLARLLGSAVWSVVLWVRRERWEAAWHRRFWPALTDRITERHPYR